MRLQSLPNAITVARLVLVPVLVAGAALDLPGVVLVGLMALAFATDFADGLLARWLGASSAFGARLDSIADFAFYLSIPLVAWLAWPQILLREAPWFAGAVASIVVPAAIAAAKFGVASGYHTWAAKLGALTMGLGVLALFGLDLAWPFRLAVVVALLAATEEVAITLVLRAPREDVRSLWHVLGRSQRLAERS